MVVGKKHEASIPATGEKYPLEAVKNFKGDLNLAPTIDKTSSLSYMSTGDEKDVAQDLWVLNSGLHGEISEHQLGEAVKTIYYCR